MTEGLMIVFTGVIAVMAIAQFFVFKWQWDAMKAQLEEMKTTSKQLDNLVDQATQNAKAAQLSADAASRNAIALINSERAWLDIRLVEQNAFWYDFRITNHGRTPAHGVAIRIDFKHFMRPEEATTSSIYLPSPQMWSSDEEHKIYDFDPQAVIGVQEWGEIRDGERHFVMKGEVFYRSVVGESNGVSGFCYNWNGASKEFERISSESFYR